MSKTIDLTRRTFLTTSAAVAVTSALPARAQAPRFAGRDQTGRHFKKPTGSLHCKRLKSLRGAKISRSPPLPVVSTHLMSPGHGASREAIRPGVHAGCTETANTDRNPVHGVSRQTGFSPADAAQRLKPAIPKSRERDSQPQADLLDPP